MTEKVNGRVMMEYYKKRRGWNEKVMSSIEWEGIASTIRNAHPLKRIKLVQLLHNWQNTGQQKGKFRDARLGQATETPNMETEEEKICHLVCPEECGEHEEELHYLECPTENMIQKKGEVDRNSSYQAKKAQNT